MNIYTQCCGLVILIILRYFYDRCRKINVNTGRAFERVSRSVVFSLMMDILSIIAITYMDKLPILLVKIICKAYLCSLCWAALMAFGYVCADISSSGKDIRKWTYRLGFTGIVIIIILNALPLSIYSKDRIVYTYGPGIIATYILTSLLMAAILYMTVRHKKEINFRRRRGVTIWMLVWIFAAVIQFFNNEFLVVGFASSIGVLIIYLILENPETRIDRASGVFNLSAFFEYVSQKIKMKEDMSIVCITYDKSIETTVSFETERQILQEIVNFLEEIPKSVVFRGSGSEFLLIFPQKEDALSAIDKIQDRFRFAWGEKNNRNLSMDWFCIESTKNIENAVDISQIFQSANAERGKVGNIHGVRIDNQMIKKIYEERDMENEIIEAMKDDRVEVFYQPIYSVKDKAFTSAEALVRIRDKQGELIPPGKFIEVAEKRGLIIQLGEIVFRKVCEFIKEHDLKEYGLKYIEVNLSMVQCGYENLADDFIQIMQETEVDPTAIILEITESASLREKSILLENMKKLKAIGVKFALDDFGTGQSNLNYIVEMPIDVVKFDSTMINAYFENGTATYVMDAAMNMIQGMDLAIVSEGIEEKEQYAKMKQLGIDYIQGYYFSKPVETEKFIDFIKENSK